MRYQWFMEKPLSKILKDDEARKNLESRYWPKVSRAADHDCWQWAAKAKHPYGYGRMTAGRGVQLKAHQIGWALANGPIPEGMSVLHECDNPGCCNPAHLFLGDQGANMRDAKRKGRMSKPPVHKGASHHLAKLSDEQVVSIKNDARPAPAVAAEYGISTKTVYRVRWGKRL